MDTFAVKIMSDILQAEVKIIIKILKYCNYMWNENCDFTRGQKRLILCFYVRFGSLITALKNILSKISLKRLKH